VAGNQDGGALRQHTLKGGCAKHPVVITSERRCSLVTRIPVAETVDNERRQQEPSSRSPMRRFSPADRGQGASHVTVIRCRGNPAGGEPPHRLLLLGSCCLRSLSTVSATGMRVTRLHLRSLVITTGCFAHPPFRVCCRRAPPSCFPPRCSQATRSESFNLGRTFTDLKTCP